MTAYGLVVCCLLRKGRMRTLLDGRGELARRPIAQKVRRFWIPFQMIRGPSRRESRAERRATRTEAGCQNWRDDSLLAPSTPLQLLGLRNRIGFCLVTDRRVGVSSLKVEALAALLPSSREWQNWLRLAPECGVGISGQQLSAHVRYAQQAHLTDSLASEVPPRESCVFPQPKSTCTDGYSVYRPASRH